MNVQEVPAYARDRQQPTLPLTDAILMAKREEAKCRDLLIPRNNVRLDSNFKIRTVEGIRYDRPGLELTDLGLRQVCQAVAKMPANTIDYYKKYDAGHHCAVMFNEFAAKAKETNLKFRMYSFEDHLSCFAVNSELYQEFPKSQILEAFLRGLQDIADVQDPYIGVKNLATKGMFHETIIKPWQLRALVVLDDFTGPRGDRYVSGLRISEKGDGTGSAEIEWFLLRVRCANGIVDERTNSKITISHKGGDAFPRLLNGIRNSIAECTRKTIDCKKQIGLLPTIEFENPFAAFAALAEKDLGERRVNAARVILDNYIKEMGPNADAVLNTVSDIGARDKVESARERAQGLGGRLLRLTPQQWLNAHARGQDILANRLAERA